MPAILIVDDHPAICFALKSSLEAEDDLSVTTTTDGGKVMSLIREHQPDLIILDIALLKLGNGPNLLIVFYVQIMPDDFIMQLHRF